MDIMEYHNLDDNKINYFINDNLDKCGLERLYAKYSKSYIINNKLFFIQCSNY